MPASFKHTLSSTPTSQVSAESNTGGLSHWLDTEDDASDADAIMTPRDECTTPSERKILRKRGAITKRPARFPKHFPRANFHKLSRGGPPADEFDDNSIHDAIFEDIRASVVSIGNETLRIFATILRWSKLPSALLIAILICMLLVEKSALTIRRTLQPLCIIPGISTSRLCLPLECTTELKGAGLPEELVYYEMVTLQSQAFEQLLQDAASGSALSLEIKKAEIATVDLVVRVSHSNLIAKEALAIALQNFVSGSKNSGRSLQKLTAQITGAVDSILAVNDYALATIVNARENRHFTWISGFKTPWRRGQESLDDYITEIFAEAMSFLSTSMHRLIVQAENSHKNLIDLEDNLAVLYAIVSQHGTTITEEKSDLLDQLWTKLGANQQSLRRLDDRLELLNGLGIYRKQALIYVVAALQTLYAMSEDMMEMRERAAQPNLATSRIPAEVHIRGMRMGLERLKEGRLKVKTMEDKGTATSLSLDG